MRIRRATTCLAAIGAAVSIVATATPASAVVNVVEAQASQNGVTVIGLGKAVVTRNDGNTVDILVTCQAVAVGVVASTGVGCYLTGAVDPTPYFVDDGWFPGNAAVTLMRFAGLPAQEYDLCIALGYQAFGLPRVRWMPHTPGDNCDTVVRI